MCSEKNHQVHTTASFYKKSNLAVFKECIYCTMTTEAPVSSCMYVEEGRQHSYGHVTMSCDAESTSPTLTGNCQSCDKGKLGGGWLMGVKWGQTWRVQGVMNCMKHSLWVKMHLTLLKILFKSHNNLNKKNSHKAATNINRTKLNVPWCFCLLNTK